MREVLSPQVCASSVIAQRAKRTWIGKTTGLPHFICEKKEVKIINVAKKKKGIIALIFLMAVSTTRANFVP